MALRNPDLSRIFRPRVDMTSGLIGWWSFDDGSGVDISGSGFPATPTNSPKATDGIVPFANSDRGGGRGKGFTTNASAYYDAGSTATLALNDCTLSIWAKTSASPGNAAIISRWSAASRSYLFWSSDGSNIAFGAANSANTIWTGGWTTLKDGNWHHLAATRLGSTVVIYFDGAAKATLASASNLPSGTLPGTITLQIGADTVGGLSTFPAGALDDCRIYNRALTPSEISSLYRSAFVPDIEQEWPSLQASAAAAFKAYWASQNNLPVIGTGTY